MSAGGRSGTENFKSYADVQAALDRENAAWKDGATGQSAEGAAARNWWYEQQIISSSMVGSTTTAASGVSGSSVPASTPPPAPVPPPAATAYSVKQPDASLVKYHPDVLPQELITDLLFEDVGGSELINIARYDTINGQDVVYSLVKNLSILNRSFNPNNILAGQIASSQFGQYSLDIASKLQSSYLDADGNLVIEFSSINNDEYAEIELSTNGTIYNIGMVIIG